MNDAPFLAGHSTVYMDNPAVHIIKDGVIIVGVISNRSMLLYPQTMYIKRSKKRNPTPAKDEQASFNTSETARKTVPMSSISQNNENARYSLVVDSEGNELSEGQQDYFKNAKTVDGDGRLKVYYHGTQSFGFTVFDIKKAKSSGTYGKGFYFSESDSHAGQYGDRYKVYLNITNPMQPGTNNITREQLTAFVEEIAENEDYGVENYGYGATVERCTIFGGSFNYYCIFIFRHDFGWQLATEDYR